MGGGSGLAYGRVVVVGGGGKGGWVAGVVGRMVGWLVGWMVVGRWSAGWLAGRMVAGWLVGRAACGWLVAVGVLMVGSFGRRRFGQRGPRCSVGTMGTI